MERVSSARDYPRRRPWTVRRVIGGTIKYGPAAAVDLAAVAASYLVAVGVRTGGRLDSPEPVIALAVTLCAGVAQVGTNILFLIYWRDWSAVAFEDLVALVKSSFAAGLFLLIFNLASDSHFFPTGAVITGAVLSLVVEGALKMRPRWRQIVRSAIGRPVGDERVVIVGAGQTGQLLARDLNDGSRVFHVVCFVDDDERRWNTYVRGVRVAGRVDDLPAIIEQLRPTIVAIAARSPSGSIVRRVVELCEGSDVRVGVARGFGIRRSSTAELRPIAIEELLERGVVDLDAAAKRAYLSGRVILVTGAAGSIGSELCRQIAVLSPRRLILLDSNESGLHELASQLPHDLDKALTLGDIKDERWLRNLFDRERPEIVVHAAAYKHVQIIEENVLAGIATNVLGTANVLAASAMTGVQQLVLISTDKAVDPANAYGYTKRFDELLAFAYAREIGRIFAVVRFGNVLGSIGSVVPIFTKQIDRGGPITVTHAEATRYFMTIPEAVGLVLEAGAIAASGDLLVLDMGAPVPIIELARKMIRLRGLRPTDVPIEFVGLRPGEKLHEKLLFGDEVAQGTTHPRVLRVEASPRIPDFAILQRIIAELREHVADNDPAAALVLVRSVVTGARAGDDAESSITPMQPHSTIG